MKRILLTLTVVAVLFPLLHSQTINYSSVKVKTKTQNRVYPYEQFVMLNYGAIGINGVKTSSDGGNALGIQYGQVHIGGWYVSADVSLSPLHFSSSYDAEIYGSKVYVFGGKPHIDKTSFNRISFGGGGIVRMVIPLYFYLGLGYMYQNTTVKTEELGWVKLIDKRYSPTHSGYMEFGLQGNIKGFTLRAGYRYGFCKNHELSVGLGWTFCRPQKTSNNTKSNE